MSENTLQFVIRTYSIIIGLCFMGVVATFIVIVLRDANNPLVQDSFNELVSLVQWALGILGAVAVAHPIATGILNKLSTSSNQAPIVTQPLAGQAATPPLTH